MKTETLADMVIVYFAFDQVVEAAEVEDIISRLADAFKAGSAVCDVRVIVYERIGGRIRGKAAAAVEAAAAAAEADAAEADAAEAVEAAAVEAAEAGYRDRRRFGVRTVTGYRHPDGAAAAVAWHRAARRSAEAAAAASTEVPK